MILLQNPSIPVATNAIEIDAAIIDIQGHLDSGLAWLTNGYGRAYKNVDATQGTTVFYPEVYLGTQNNSQRYTNISPDNDKQGQNFFFVTKETISQFQPGMFSFLTYDTAIIFSVNMELINATLLNTEIYQQILIAQVRDVLTRQLLGSSYQLKINSVDLLFDNVFSEFDLKDAAQLEKAPLSHFRFNCSITLPELCPTPVLPPVVCYSMQMDGVNELIQAPINSAFNLDRNNAMSIEVWVKFNTVNVFNYVFSKYLSPTGILFSVNSSNELRFDLQNNGGLNGIIINSTGAGIGLNIWYHLMVTYDGSSLSSGVKFYKDGVLLSNAAPIADTLSLSILNAQNVQIGSLSTLGYYVNGLFNYVRWWNIELTQSDVTYQYDQKASSSVIESASLVLDCSSGNAATWNVSEFDIADPTSITAGYQTINAEELDKTLDCPV
tara:strand:- start:4305 stop:5618 length:1314 start_codon:yes stop_codon:yes gene_type:complete